MTEQLPEDLAAAAAEHAADAFEDWRDVTLPGAATPPAPARDHLALAAGYAAIEAASSLAALGDRRLTDSAPLKAAYADRWRHTYARLLAEA